MSSKMLRTSISFVAASLVATSLLATAPMGANAAGAENVRHAPHAYASRSPAGRGYPNRSHAGRSYVAHAPGSPLLPGTPLPYGPEYGFLRRVPPDAIVGPGYTFVPGVGILGESCDLPTSACPNEYRDVR